MDLYRVSLCCSSRELCAQARQLDSTMLISSLLSHAKEAHWDEFTLEIERLMSSHSIEDSTPSILDFQANMVRVASRRKNAPLTPERDEVQALLNMIWRVSKVDETPLEMYGSPRVEPLMTPQLNGHPKVLAPLEGWWWKLGFGSDDRRAEFKIGGMLALDCLVCHLLSLERNGHASLAETICPCRTGEVFRTDTGAE